MLIFLNSDGGIMFKIFVGRDEKRDLKADQLAKFRAFANGLQAELDGLRFRGGCPILFACRAAPRTISFTTDWLAEHLSDPRPRRRRRLLVSAAMNRDGFKEYQAAHIPGAVYFDIDEISDHGAGLPHMLPPPEAFALHMRRLGIGDWAKIVVYDGAGLFSAPRVWWTFRVFGANDVSVLEGGFPEVARRGPSDGSGHGQPGAREVHAEVQPDSSLRILIASSKRSPPAAAQVVDVRSAARFRGEAPEPRPGVRPGRMPGQSQRAVDGDRGRRQAGITRENPCGSCCRRRRPRQADHHELRFRRIRRDSLARAGRDRQAAAGPL